MLIGTGVSRILSTPSTVNAFTLTAGRALLSSLPSGALIGMGEPERRLRSLEILPLGTDAADETYSYRLWRYKFDAGSRTSGVLDLLCTGTVTLGTATGLTGDGLVATGELFADTVTVAEATTGTTPAGIGATLAASLSADFAAYSPANNTIARILVPDVADADLIVYDTALGGSAAGAAALVMAYA